MQNFPRSLKFSKGEEEELSRLTTQPPPKPRSLRVNEPVVGMKKRHGYEGLRKSTTRARQCPQWMLPRSSSSTHVHKETQITRRTAERITPGQFLLTWLFKNRKGRGLEGTQKKLNWSPLKCMRPPGIFCSNFLQEAQGQSVPTLPGTSRDHCISLIN